MESMLKTLSLWSMIHRTTFCCDIELKTETRQVLKYKPVRRSKWEEKEVVIGYEDCGIVGQSVCPIMDSVWK